MRAGKLLQNRPFQTYVRHQPNGPAGPAHWNDEESDFFGRSAAFDSLGGTHPNGQRFIGCLDPLDETRNRNIQVVICNHLNAFFPAQIAQPCSEMIRYCEWQDEPVNCSTIFQLVPSNQGFCCGYNLNDIHLMANSSPAR